MIEFSNQPTPSLDRFGRRTKPRWNRPLILQNSYYGHGRDSYLISSDDMVMDGLNWQPTIDGLERLFASPESLSGSHLEAAWR